MPRRLGGRRLDARTPIASRACRARTFLAELVCLRETVVVAGAHGKTTTTGMIAYVLAQLGRDPAYAIGGDDSAARRQRRHRRGMVRRRGRRVGSDDRGAAPAGRRRAQRRARPSHASSRRSRRFKRSSTTGRRTSRTSCARRSSSRSTSSSRCRGEHNRRNAAAALAALEHCGVVARRSASRTSLRSGARRAVSSCAARSAASSSTTTTPIIRPRSRRRLATAREVGARPRARALPAAPLLAHATPRARVRSRARRRPTSLRSRTCTRRASSDGDVRGKLVVGRGVGRARGSARRVDAVARAGALAGSPRSRVPGDVVLTVGAGDVDARRAGAARGARVKIEEDVPLARYTTLGTGGPARLFARPETLAELEEALASRGARKGWASPSSGSGRTCSPPTTASTGSCSGSRGELAAVAVDGEPRHRRAAARRTPSSCIARARRASAASSSRARSRARPAAASG